MRCSLQSEEGIVLKLKEILKNTEKLPFQNKVCHIAVISNITLNPYLIPFMKLSFSGSNVLADVQIIRLENYLNESDKIRSSNLLAVILNFEFLHPNWYNDILSGKVALEQIRTYAVEQCRDVYCILKENISCPIVWFGYENENFQRTSICGSVSLGTKIIDSINADICSFLGENDSHIDTRHLITKVGISNAYDNKNKYRWNAPYSQQMIRAISDEIHKQYLVQKGISKKCLVLDCDGVLWGGTLSEDGIEQIKLGSEGLGRPYQDFQRFLLTLYYHGVILAVCSKNDLQDVIRVFREHSGMILKAEHIACFQVDWDNKPNNIRRIAEALNIGLDSIVFVDDSPFEVESVRTLLPDIMAVQYDRNTIYESLACFNLKSQVNLKQVADRNLTYQSNSKRKKLRSESADFESYLTLLKMKVDIHRALSSEVARIAELTQRTNQCTNGARYTVSEISERLNNPLYHLYSVYVSDMFADLGLVGVIGINDTTLDLFSLSCRALGRNVEEKMIKLIRDEKVVEYKFVSTGKNEALGNLFAINKQI